MRNLNVKLALMQDCEQEIRELKKALESQKIGLRAHEQELALECLKLELSDWLDSHHLYLIGRQLSKALRDTSHMEVIDGR